MTFTEFMNFSWSIWYFYWMQASTAMCSSEVINNKVVSLNPSICSVGFNWFNSVMYPPLWPTQSCWSKYLSLRVQLWNQYGPILRTGDLKHMISCWSWEKGILWHLTFQIQPSIPKIYFLSSVTFAFPNIKPEMKTILSLIESWNDSIRTFHNPSVCGSRWSEFVLYYYCLSSLS